MCNFQTQFLLLLQPSCSTFAAHKGAPCQQLGNHQPKGSDITVEKIQFCNTF